MWAPADLFNPVLNIFLSPLKRMVSYFYEHLMVLALALIAIAALIALATWVAGRRGRSD